MIGKMEQESAHQKYHERYDEFKKKGHEFFPYVIVEGMVTSLVVFAIVVLLTVTLGVTTEPEADPTNTAYIPRPEWYFMFLFQMIKYFPGELEWVGVVVVPAIVVAVLLLLPFYDRNPRHSLKRRPLSMVFTALSVLVLVFLTFEAYRTTPAPTIAAAPVKLTAVQEAGKRLFQAKNCTACHSVNGVGGQVAPDLWKVSERRDAATIHQYIERPMMVNPDSKMPPFIPPLSHDEVEQITQYLLTLK